MKIIRIFKKNYKLVAICSVIPAVLALIAAVVFAPSKYESKAILYIPQNPVADAPEFLKTKPEWIIPPVKIDDLNILINDTVIQNEIAMRLLASHLTLQSANPEIISKKKFNRLKKSIPELYDLFCALKETGNI